MFHIIDMFQHNNLVCVVLVAALTASPTYQDSVKNYEGYEVFRLKISSNETLQALTDLHKEGSWDFWMEPQIYGTADVMVSPQQLPVITSIINEFHVEYEIMFQSLDRAILREKKISLTRVATKMNWNAYHRLDVIYEWMDSLVQLHSGKNSTVKVEVIIIGESYEKRPMKVLKISREQGSTNAGNRSAIWLDGGIHAREWIAPATVTFIANEVINANAKSEPWASIFDWYIAPCTNPDGYEYSHTYDRFWRKTRSLAREGNSLIDSIVNNLCVGADPNRNWDYQWGGLGASGNPCAPNYRGKESASEIEVQNVQNFMLTKAKELKLYITMHSYSQIILLPWGHSYIYADDFEELLRVARKAAKKLQSVHGTIYRTGATPHVLYPASGGSHDWAKGVAGIKYSYTVELPDRGYYGFLLPASRIIPTGQETLELVKSMAMDMIDVYNLQKTINL